jgi:hypothetical protein
MLYFIASVAFDFFIFGFGILVGIYIFISDAKKYGYMKIDPKDNRLKWAHKIKE